MNDSFYGVCKCIFVLLSMGLGFFHFINAFKIPVDLTLKSREIMILQNHSPIDDHSRN